MIGATNESMTIGGATTTATTEEMTSGLTGGNVRRRNCSRRGDNSVNSVKVGAKRDISGAYAKLLGGPCPTHPDANHTMGDCRGLKSHFRERLQDPNSRKRPKRDDAELSDRRMKDKVSDEGDKEEEEERDPRHNFKAPDRSV